MYRLGSLVVHSILGCTEVSAGAADLDPLVAHGHVVGVGAELTGVSGRHVLEEGGAWVD